MIKNQWYAVLDAKELKENKPIGVERFSQKLAFWKDEEGNIGCVIDRCCHRGASISQGKIKDKNIECPFHGFQYNKFGRVTLIPANGRGKEVPKNFKLNSYIVKEAYGFIWLWYGDRIEDLPEIPFFEELKSGYSYGSFSEQWGVHYTRAIENQLDVVHLPFVHKTTIGKGNKTIVNGPVVKWQENLMTFYVKNEEDRGQEPEKSEAIKDYEKLFNLQFQMPNIWQNRISDKIRILAAFAPIDEENTMIYLRFYQNFMKVPVLKQMVNSISNISNKIILHQDREVVLNQIPKKSEVSMGENLIQGDLPIIEFRKRRKELQDKHKNI